MLHDPTSGAMGELVDLGNAVDGGFSAVSALISLAAVGLYALLQGGTKNNDDDDSTPGGGLMQPVS
ncbi:MAG: hypothetical protein ACKOXO_10245 [Cyanobium sp.]